MPIQKLILAYIVLASALLGSVLAADKPAAQTDVNKLQEQVRTLDKELAVQREAFVRKLDDVEKRQNKITAQQANSLAAISKQNTTVGNYIAWTSGGITVLLFIAGFVIYLSTASRAEKEARTASKLWFDENSRDLTNKIDKLRTKAEAASSQIETHTDSVKSKASSAIDQIDASVATAVLNFKPNTSGEQSAVVIDLAATQIVREFSEALKTKPESEFTAQDFFARGLNYYTVENYQSALSSLESAIRLANNQTPAATLAQYLFAKGVTLGTLHRSEAEIAVYDELVQRFGSDTTPDVREQVAKGLFNKGLTLGILEKREAEIAVYDDLVQRFGADTTPAVREQVASGLVNKGLRLVQLDKFAETIAVYDELAQRFGADTTPTVREQVASGLVNKGIMFGTLDKPEAAIAVYDELVQRFGADTTPAVREQVASGLVNKGVRLVQLDKFAETIAVNDELVQHFGEDTAPAVREKVAIGLNSAGFARIMLAKQHWPDEARRVELLGVATIGLKCAAVQSREEGRPIAFGNWGYALFLGGDRMAAEAPTLEYLQLGGQRALDAQRIDAKLHRVEPEDSQYEELQNSLWQSLSPEATQS